jgi:TRAP transporter TAXI family solute receptor
LYGVVPIPVFSELEMSRPVKILTPNLEMLKKLVASLGGHSIVPIRAGVYKAVEKPIPTLGTFQTLIVRADMAEEDAYMVSKLAFGPENLKKFKGLIRDYGDALTPERAAEGVAAPLHPGAERYYRERGWLK